MIHYCDICDFFGHFLHKCYNHPSYLHSNFHTLSMAITFTLFLILECELVGGSESCFPLNLQGRESYRACSPIGLVSLQEETLELTNASSLCLSVSLSACKVMWHKQKVPSTSQEENPHQHQLLTSWYWMISSFQIWGRINFSFLSHSVCIILLQQP